MSSMRESMPQTAAWIDDLRATFGPESVNGSIRAGIGGLPVFFAAEAGHELGTPATLPADGRLHVFTDGEVDEMQDRIAERAEREERGRR